MSESTEFNPYQSPNAIVTTAVPTASGEFGSTAIGRYQSGHTLAVVSIILLVVQIGLFLALVAASLFELPIVSRMIAGDTEAYQSLGQIGSLEQMSRIGWLIAYVITGLFFFAWLYRCHSNLKAFDIHGLEFSPWGMVGWWFCPFANLWKPYQAVREVCRGSDPERADPGSLSWKTNPQGATLLGWWWAIWIVRLLADQVVSKLPVSTPGEIKVFIEFTLVDCAICIAGALLTIAVIRRIDSFQTANYERLRALPTPRSTMFDQLET